MREVTTSYNYMDGNKVITFNNISKINMKNIKLINKNIFICYTFKRN